jgi:molecular chaperone GrpE
MPKSKNPPQDPRIAEITADLQRLQAEFINYKRRAEAERTQAVQTGKEQAIIALLPVIDNIERAIAHEPTDITNHQWVKGITLLAKQLDGQLEILGLRKIGEVGETFDPNRHEAVVLEDDHGETEVVSDVIQNGYQLGENVIRPALVKVKKV